MQSIRHVNQADGGSKGTGMFKEFRESATAASAATRGRNRLTGLCFAATAARR